MCNPFGNDSICGWRPSLLARDLSSGSEWGSMNIHMNQAMADMQARSTLYMTPTMSWGAFSDYGMPSGGMNFLCDPRYTIGQWQWNQNQMCNGGFGNFGMNGMNWGNNPWGNFGWNGGNTSGTSSSASTPEERAAQRKYNKLLSLVKQLASDDSRLPAARKEALDEIAKHPVGKTYEEKLKNLKAEYDRVSKEDIKKFLASNAAKDFTVDAGTNKANSFYNRLQKVGFEYDNSAVDSEISGLYDVISQIKDTQENYQNSSILADLAAKTGTYDILDVVSSWNTQKKGSTGEDKRIITLIKKGYDALPSGETGDAARSSVKTNVISPVVNGLLDRARELKADLDSASQTKLSDAMTKLERAYNNTTTSVDSNLSSAFDELYLLTRKAAIAQLRNEIKEAYGAIDPDLFNDTLFDAETKADLKAEGFDETAINAATVNFSASNDSGIYSQRVDETKPAREQLEAITGTDKPLRKVSVSGIAGVTEAWVDNNTDKVYVLKQNADGEDEIHEVDDYTIGVNGGVTGGTIGAKVSANDIAAASAAAKQEAQELAAEKTAVTDLLAKSDIIQETGTTSDGHKIYKEQKGDQREFVLIDGVLYEWKNNAKGDKVTANSIETAYNSAVSSERSQNSDLTAAGTEVAELLCGWTDSDDDDDIAFYLNKVDENNILTFLKGYYAEAGKGGEGLIEKLDDDTDSDTVTMEMKKKIISSTLKKAKEMGLSGERSYIKLESYLTKFNQESNSSATSFNKLKNYWASTWVIGSLWGGWTNYNEAIDDELEKLFDKMNA